MANEILPAGVGDLIAGEVMAAEFLMLLAATTPGSEVANTALTDGSTDVTIAMRAKRYTLDDLARYITDGKLDPVMLAQDSAISVAQTLISLLANVGDDFTSTVGSTGVNAVWTDIIDAKTTLG